MRAPLYFSVTNFHFSFGTHIGKAGNKIGNVVGFLPEIAMTTVKFKMKNATPGGTI